MKQDHKTRKLRRLITSTVCVASSLISLTAFSLDKPRNVIGFYQSYDDPTTWVFDGIGESLADSGYTMLVDAFWTNYPYCWGDGSGRPGAGSPIPACKGIVDAPGPGVSNTLDHVFWDGYYGQTAPDMAGEAYNRYWTSFHASGPSPVSQLRQKIDQIGTNTITKQKIKLIAGIGGWNMGGSAAGQPHTPAPPQKPAWAALLKEPAAFAQAMADIVNLKVNGTTIYDGIDIDLETLYGLGCEDTVCDESDKDKAVDKLVESIVAFKKLEPETILSTSPRASDIACEQRYCAWNTTDGLGFMGEVLQKLAQQGVYFDHINPQFYNDDGERNIPNGMTDDGLSYGNQVIGILTKLKETGGLGEQTELNIGVLSQTNSGDTDTGGAPAADNPGVSKATVPGLWQLLQEDPAFKATGLEINGIMTWSVNLALNGTGIGGNVRSSNSPAQHVIPYNWAADLF